MDLKIIAVIVTYNRKKLLKDCIEACLNQTFNLEKIIIINNASTDNTIEFLENNNLLKNKKIKLVTLQKNKGGSGGFYYGIKLAMNDSPDFVWLMDDDCIPKFNSLQKLLENYEFLKYNQEKIGFLCSQVNWIDHSPHIMNIPSIPQILRGDPFSKYYKKNIFLVNSCSFVSVLVSKEAIKAVGLPLKEYFIWGDDLEYTNRISDAGFINALVLDSEVIHKTKENYSVSILKDNSNNAWKYFYNSRNKIHQLKRRGIIGFFIFFVSYSRDFKNIMKRKDHRYLFFRNVTLGYISGLFFRAKIKNI